MTKEQAKILVNTHEVQELMDNEEEIELLEQNNPGLADAYRALLDLANAR